ncbi:PQQ-dependent sugar dehydrogenase [Nocardioides aequoreus]|uniref:PQQ-dependent sugar dehydrogenase n=1 Tax=Nocardioides aequoreus TaxID=397278 RepID=UPI0004C3995B|nr:PQQ-dependent sugar dehydrogenase [Nocardioides aequoreus]
MKRLAALLVVPTLLLSACGEDTQPSAGETPTAGETSGSPEESPEESPSASASESVEAPRSGPPEVLGTVARGLEAPWGIAFLPDGSALVTERDTERVFQVGDGEVRQVGTIGQAAPGGEAGLLGLAVSPSFEDDARVFFYLTTDTDNRVLRGTFRDGEVGGLEPILTGIPKNTYHDGGQLAFGPEDEQLYVATGDAGDPDLAQDRESLAGKVLRVDQDGEPSRGNPGGSPVWSYGHRNVQGLAFDDRGRLWASEFGQDTFDELNLIVRGGNYGWPLAEGRGGPEGTIDPEVQWATDDASPSGLAFAGGRLWMAALRGERLWRIGVDADGATDDRAFLEGEHGRLRLAAAAPDGNLWVATSNRDGRGEPADDDDRILLLRP